MMEAWGLGFWGGTADGGALVVLGGFLESVMLWSPGSGWQLGTVVESG